MENPDKTKIYEYIGDGSRWKIWEDEKFEDETALLYEVETGEDMTIRLVDFVKCLKEVVE